MPPQAKPQHSAAQHSTAQHSTAQHSTAQHSTQALSQLSWCLYTKCISHTARQQRPSKLLCDRASPAVHLQGVEKEATALSDINLPSSFRSPCTRFGPARASSLPTHPDSRSSSPDFLTQLGQPSAALPPTPHPSTPAPTPCVVAAVTAGRCTVAESLLSCLAGACATFANEIISKCLE